MGGSPAKTTSDSTQTQVNPNQGYVDWANQQQKNQYNQIQPATTQLLGNFNNPSSINPLLTAASGAVQGDITGQGGPYTSLKNNLLGNFDTGAQKTVLDPLKNQLIKEGIYSSGPGISLQNDAGTQLAQQRGLLGSQVDVQELNMANQLGQQTFQDQITALMTALGLVPPQVQNVGGGTTTGSSTSTSTPASQGAMGLLGQIAGQVIPALLTGGASLPFSLGSSVAGGGIGAGGLGALQAFGGGVSNPGQNLINTNPSQYQLGSGLTFK